MVTLYTLSGVDSNPKGQTCCFISLHVCTFVLIFLLQSDPFMAQSVDREIGTVTGYIGESATLQCDLRNIYDNELIIWYHNDREEYISYNEDVFSFVPTNISDRMSVVCETDQDLCSLTITALTFDDNGTYTCGYGYISGDNGHLRIHFLNTGSLIVKYGNPPSDDSPTCNFFIFENGQYIPDDEHYVGETIFLQCAATGATTKPSLEWTQDNASLGIPAKGAIFHQVTLTEEDIGAVFTCVMTHPALIDPKSCSLTPLPVVSTTLSIRQTTSPSLSTFSKFLPSVSSTGASVTHDDMTNSKSVASSRKQSYILPVIISTIMVLVVLFVVVLVFFVIWRKRKQKSVIPRQPDYELTFNRDCSITPDYAAVNAPDTIDVLASSGSEPQTQHCLLQQHPVSSANVDDANEDTFPVYAKPDKKRKKNNGKVATESSVLYANLPHHHLGDVPEEDASNGRLMYAELDLPVMSARKPKPSDDATIYARIEGTL